MSISLEGLAEWREHFGEGETAVERLGAALFVNSDHPHTRLMVMFTAYFDASGNGVEQPFVVVSGYVANFLQWRMFEHSWKAIHKEHDVQLPFHMSPFIEAITYPQSYAKQKNARADYVEIAKYPKKVDKFLRGLCITQEGMVSCGFSCIVEMGLYGKVNDQFDLRDVIPPYALGARVCLALVHTWEGCLNIEENAECIFEKGDFEQSKFTELLISEGHPSPIYKPKDEFSGLQAADMYAWEQYHCKKKELKGEQLPYRDSFNSLLTAIPKLHGVATEELLVGLCKAKGINAKEIK